MSVCLGKGMPLKKVKARVIEVRGNCVAGFKVGEELVFDGMSLSTAPKCVEALCAIYPMVYGKQRGASYPFQNREGVTFSGCPSPDNTVAFAIEEIK
ncbi:MAG: TIGR04076 family protein [Chloroflexi bacterium]|nr:TIGR04076 family protein [Chloroflexota bacterium]MCL5075378.1 TIGR04076 family protein [Chloroflexota bacterium]